MAKYLHPEQPIYGIQAKGLNGTDKLLDKMEDIAAHYIDEIMKRNPDGPYAIGGYSFRGLIAFEMSNRRISFKKVGIDVEEINPHFDWQDILQTSFSKDEIFWVEQSKSPKDAFYLLYPPSIITSKFFIMNFEFFE